MSKHKHLHKNSILRLTVFGAATVVFAALSVYGLVQNSQGAKDRFDNLVAVDKAGGDVESALNELRVYIYSHMNTQIGNDLGINPPIQLSGTYNRLVTAERERVAAINESLQEDAQAFCESTQGGGFSGRFRVECIAEYTDENGATEQSVEDDFYKFDFASPVWSADIAGISIALTIVSGLSFIVQLLLYRRTKHMVSA